MNTHNTPWIIGYKTMETGPVPLISTTLQGSDIRGGWKARWNIDRMDYKVAPGLYGVGEPTVDSPVLVTANYKLTFDQVRSSLTGIDAWLLVLDTKGINVWCAAGKGTFGTEELLRRLESTRLAQVVKHRTLIVPQLGAVGIAAHQVKKASGFTVKYGPVRCTDIKAYLAAGFKKSPAMGRVTFSITERMVLIPIELVQVFKKIVPVLLVLGFVFALLDIRALSLEVLKTGLIYGGGLLGAILAGTVLVPLFLPYIPLRSFALKGALLGGLWAAAFTWLTGFNGITLAVWLLLFIPIAAFVSLNFTGSTTFTSLAGVKQEVRIATPLFIILPGLGLILKVFTTFGVL